MLSKMKAIGYVLLAALLTSASSADYQMLPEGAIVKLDPANQTVAFLKGANLSLALEENSAFRRLLLSDQFDEVAITFLEAYRSPFKIANPRKEFIIKSINKDELGYNHIRLNQVYAGLSVWGAELIIHLDKNNHVYLVNGHYIPTPTGLKLQPALSKQEINKIVADQVLKTGYECSNCSVNLLIFDRETGKPTLAYQVFASVSLAEAWEIIIDANTGVILKKLPRVYNR